MRLIYPYARLKIPTKHKNVHIEITRTSLAMPPYFARPNILRIRIVIIRLSNGRAADPKWHVTVGDPNASSRYPFVPGRYVNVAKIRRTRQYERVSSFFTNRPFSRHRRFYNREYYKIEIVGIPLLANVGRKRFDSERETWRRTTP